MRAACPHRINGYYNTVPAVPTTGFGNRERRERLGTAIEKYRFFQQACSGTLVRKARKTAAFPFPVTVIERGVSGHPLSLQTTGRAKDSDYAQREDHTEPLFDTPASAPSGTASIVGRIGPVACHAAAWREPAAALGAGSPRASVFRPDRSDLISFGCIPSGPYISGAAGLATMAVTSSTTADGFAAAIVGEKGSVTDPETGEVIGPPKKKGEAAAPKYAF